MLWKCVVKIESNRCKKSPFKEPGLRGAILSISLSRHFPQTPTLNIRILRDRRRRQKISKTNIFGVGGFLGTEADVCQELEKCFWKTGSRPTFQIFQHTVMITSQGHPGYWPLYWSEVSIGQNYIIFRQFWSEDAPKLIFNWTLNFQRTLAWFADLRKDDTFASDGWKDL